MENDERDLQNSKNNNSSQLNSVNSFGVSTPDTENLKTNIDNNKQKNLNNQNNSNNSFNINNSLNNNSSELKSRIDESRAKNLRNNVSPTQSNFSSNNAFPKSSELDSGKKGSIKSDKSSSNKGEKKGGGIGSLAANSALNLAASKSEAVNKGVQAADFVKTTTKVIKAIISFFATPFGWGALLVTGIILLVVFIGMFVGIVIDSIGSFFGLTGSETYESFGEKYEEGMSTGKLNEIMSEVEDPDGNKLCERGFFTATKNFFGVWNIGDPCELTHYVRKMIDNKEGDTNISVISPGYFMSAIYYAYDTQNRDENGNPYLKPEVTNESELESINDLDAISIVISSGLYDKVLRDKILGIDMNFYNNIFGSTGIQDLFTEASSQFLLGLNPFTVSINSIKTLLGQNSERVNEIMLNNILDENILHYRGNYSYYKYETITNTNPLTGETSSYQTCVDHNPGKSYEVSDDKFKLYLRYGARVSQEYEDDMDKVRAYDRTDSQCINKLGFEKPDMDKYKIKADTETTEDDNAKITLSSGTYGYDSGFIYNTYPKYMKEYTPDKEIVYNYWTDKDIEHIISNIESRQDYTNYILGYPSSIKSNIGVCTYNIDGIDISNIKVRLLHGASKVEGINRFDPIEGEELVDFDTYIIGVVYGEVGGFDDEVLKTQAIAARSYALARVKSMKGLSLTEENGEWILSIRNSDEDQGYCNPDKGCYFCDEFPGTEFSAGATPEGATCTLWKGPLPKDHKIREVVKEVNGMILVDSKGKPLHASYVSDTQKGWQEMAKSGLDYVEILKKTYSDATLQNGECTIGANGFIWPTNKGWKITSYFGTRVHPITGEINTHSGVDIAGFPMDSPVYAIGNGVVTRYGFDNSMGNYIKIDHGNGYESIYMHMNKFIPDIKDGMIVSGGQQIGYMGTTGSSTGVHLHLTIKLNGKLVDPLEVMGVEG